MRARSRRRDRCSRWAANSDLLLRQLRHSASDRLEGRIAIAPEEGKSARPSFRSLDVAARTGQFCPQPKALHKARRVDGVVEAGHEPADSRQRWIEPFTRRGGVADCEP